MNMFLLLWLLPTYLAIGDFYEVSVVEKPISEFIHGVHTLSTYPSDQLEEEKKAPYQLLTEQKDPTDVVPFLGTIFFQGPRQDCFVPDAIALMRARQAMEMLVPKAYPNCISNCTASHILVRYWAIVNHIIHLFADEDTLQPLEHAFHDTLGAYLRYYLVPMSQLSFYAGHCSLKNLVRLEDIKQKCYYILHTNGVGWRAPASKNILAQLNAINIQPMWPPIKDYFKICDQLDLRGLSQELDREKRMLPLPLLDRVDDNGELTNIVLPFRKHRVYNLRARNSAFELDRFLRTISGCHRQMGISQANYNSKLLNWMKEMRLTEHVADEPFYPGLAGILQIQKSLLLSKVYPGSADDNSTKLGRSVSTSWAQDDLEMDNIIVFAAIAMLVLFAIVIIYLHCCPKCIKWGGNNSQRNQKDVESAVSFKMTRLKHHKREKKVKLVETPMSPLKISSDKRYYGYQGNSLSGDDCSTSTLGYHLKEKLLPIRFENVRANFKYSPLFSLENDFEMAKETQEKDKKRGGRGK